MAVQNKKLPMMKRKRGCGTTVSELDQDSAEAPDEQDENKHCAEAHWSRDAVTIRRTRCLEALNMPDLLTRFGHV